MENSELWVVTPDTKIEHLPPMEPETGYAIEVLRNLRLKQKPRLTQLEFDWPNAD